MSRKHYIAIAKVLASQWATATAEGKAALWPTVLSLADVFKQDNTRFDRVRFYYAVFNTDQYTARKECAF